MSSMPLISTPNGRGDHDFRRRTFFAMWLRSWSDSRALAFLQAVSDDPAARAEAAQWIEDYRSLRRDQEAAEVHALQEQRASLRGASLLLERFCDHQGLSMAAVAYGVLPSAHILTASEGYPWSTCGSPEARRAVWASYHSRMKDGWERRFYREGAFIRPRDHPAGRWAVKQVRGVLLTSFVINGARFSTGVRFAHVDLTQPIPETVKAALPGRLLNDVVEHAVLAEPRFTIRRMQDLGGGVRIFFDCPVVATSLANFASVPPSHRHQQLGRDGSLSGKEAMRDVLARSRTSSASRMGDAGLAAAMAGGIFAGAERERIRAINLMAPPWADLLELPR